jgi:hypothetical protein
MRRIDHPPIGLTFESRVLPERRESDQNPSPSEFSDYAFIDDWQEILGLNPVSHYLMVDFHPNGCGPTGSPCSLIFPTLPRTTLGRRELLFHPHSEQDLINQVIAILLRQRRESKQEPVIHGRENGIDQ